MLHLYTLLAQLTDEQRGEQFGEGLFKLIVIAIAIIGVIVWLKRRGSSND